MFFSPRSFLFSMMGENSVLHDQNRLSETGDTGEHFCSLRYHKHRDKKSQNFSLNEKRNHYLQKLLEELTFLSESVYQRNSYSKQTILPLL